MRILQIALALFIGFIIGAVSMYFDTKSYPTSFKNWHPTEYQFIVTDDSISVTDFDRQVGTVKLEGQLKELIDKDNE